MTTFSVPSHSLIGMALSDAEQDARSLSRDEDGYLDPHEADHRLGQHDQLELAVAGACDVLSTFAEEALRWAP